MSDTVILDGELSLTNQLDGQGGVYSRYDWRGYSAYEIAVQEGFEGTKAEWLASLQGEDGQDGKDGQDGDDYILTEEDKEEIADMLNGSVSVSGTTPTITAKSGIRYVCGEVSTLDLTPPATGICDVVFTSGTTPTVLTVPSTVKWANGFDPSSLDANTIYELNIMDGLGVACAWT